jgi:hypothetical protein
MEQTVIGTNTQPKTLFRAAGAMAILITLAGLADAITSAGIAAQDNSTIPVVEWFALFQSNWFATFSRLGLINIITLLLGIPIYLAFTQAHRREHPVLAPFAAILFFMGAVIYFSSNTVFSLFALSQQYAASSEAQKPLLETAGRALLAQGADLTSGTFLGLFLVQIAGILITIGMLRGSVFGKWTGRAGLAGFILMIVFFIITAFAPEHYDTAMFTAMPAALILITYQIMLARQFYHLGR